MLASRLVVSSARPASRPKWRPSSLWSAQLRNLASDPPQSTQDATIVKLREALKESMKSRDKLRTGTIKSALADIQNAQHLPSPPAPLKTLRLAISRRLEASAASRSASPARQDLASQYDAEARLLEAFLPSRGALMSERELAGVVERIAGAMEGVKEEGQKAMGRVVKRVREEVGDRAEGKEIAAAVKRYLQA